MGSIVGNGGIYYYSGVSGIAAGLTKAVASIERMEAHILGQVPDPRLAPDGGSHARASTALETSGVGFANFRISDSPKQTSGPNGCALSKT